MRSTRTRALRILALGLLASALVGVPATATTPTLTLVPIGSDYQPDTLQLFAREAAGHDRDGTVHILVMPITYSLSGLSTTKSERKKNLTLADNRRGLVEDACNVVRDPAQTCLVELVPSLVRADASDPAVLAYFDEPVDGMFSLGGDQGVAMQVVQDTPLEAAMTAAFAQGAVFGGNSAGDAVQSRIMLNGYLGSYGPAESLRQGVLDIRDDVPPWDGSTLADLPTRGLAFGFPNLVTDQHVFEYGRTGRSLNLALTTGKPVLGMDAATGAVVTDYSFLRSITGDTNGYVIDPGTFGANATFGGPNHALRTRDVVFHLLPANVAGAGFDFAAMQPIVDDELAANPIPDERSYAGTFDDTSTLYVSGGIVGDPAGLVGQSFVTDAGGSSARIVVLAAGFAKNADASADAKAIASALAPSVAKSSWFVLDSRLKTKDALAAIADATGIIVTGRDASLVVDQLHASPAWGAAVARWANGTPLLADDAAAAAVGSRVFAKAPAADVEAGAIDDATNPVIAQGDALAGDVSFATRLLPDQRWPQLFQLTPLGGIAAGIDVGTALRVSGGSASVVGDSAVVLVDGRHAVRNAGSPANVLDAAWLMLDTYVDGDTVVP